MISSNKPTALNNLDNLPDELKVLDQWVGWNSTKFPVNVRIGNKAEVDNPGTWSPFEVVRKAVESGKYRGVGFVFTADDPYTGIDLDEVCNPDTGEIKPEAQNIIDLLDSYTEISQSGTGVHVLVRGKKPGGRCRAGNIEIYDQGRYFALTGNLLDEARSTIEDRQEQLDTLYYDTFGKGATVQGSKETSDYDISGLVFDGSASPPLDKLKKRLKSDVFTETWEYRRTDLNDTSLSSHAMSLASQVKDWADQEILDLVIAFYRKWGETKEKIEKPLRPEIIRGILLKIRRTDVQKELPLEVKEIIQYGEQDAEYTIVTKNGEHIDMGETSAFLSPRRARQRLLERGHFLSSKAMKNWPQIIEALMPLIKIQPTVTTLEETEQWLRNHLSIKYTSIVLIDPDDPKRPDSLSRALTLSEGYTIIRDKQGRIYLSLNGIIAHARMTLGQNLTQKALAIRLKKMGFERAGVSSDYSGGKSSRVKMWMSPAGYLPPADTDVKTPAASLNLPGETCHPIEEGDDDFSLLKPSPTPLEEAARKIREKGI